MHTLRYSGGIDGRQRGVGTQTHSHRRLWQLTHTYTDRQLGEEGMKGEETVETHSYTSQYPCMNKHTQPWKCI